MTEVSLPEPVHTREQSQALAVPQAPTGFEIGGEDIRPPRLKICQDPKTQAATFGDLFIQDSKDDPHPTIIQDNSKLTKGTLSDPIRFYALASRRGVNFHMPEHPDAGFNGMVLGPWHTTVAQFMAVFPHAIDPQKVYRKYDFVLTVPDFPELPVQFLLASSAGGAAAAELNKLIRMAQQRGEDPTEIPFALQVRQVDKGEYTFMKAYINLADVPQEQVASDLEIVEEHRSLLPRATLADEGQEPEGTTNAEATDVPDLS
jgi:hypothetical protein